MESEEKKENKAENQEASTLLSAKKQRRKEILRKIGVGVLVATLFSGGVLAGRLSLDKELRNLAKIKRAIQKEYYEEIDDSTFYDAVFDGVNGVLDSYSYYMTADEYTKVTAESKGEQSGIGLVFQTKDESGNPQLLIKRVCGNSPAYSAGIQAGWRVTGFGINGEMQESVLFADLQSFLAGIDIQTTFDIQVETIEGKTLVVPLQKAVYIENYVFYRTNTQSYGFIGENADGLKEKNEGLSCLDDETAYIRLVKFNGSAAQGFAKVMTLFREQGKKNLVLDLRGNGGGSIDILQEIAAYLCKDAVEKKPSVAVINYGEKQEIAKAAGNYYHQYFSQDSRIFVLADGDSASASECLLGAMLDYKTIDYADICLIGDINTAKTFGKGIMQTTYVYPMGDAIKLTTATIHWPTSNTCIHGRGILATDGTKFVPRQSADDAEIALAMAEFYKK